MGDFFDRCPFPLTFLFTIERNQDATRTRTRCPNNLDRLTHRGSGGNDIIEDQDIVEVVQRNQDVDPVGLPFLNLAGDAVCLRARRIIANLVAAELARGSSRVA